MSFRGSLFGRILQGAGKKILQAAAEEVIRAAAEAESRKRAGSSTGRGSTRGSPFGAYYTSRLSKPVDENISVVLRRQIPVRFDEPPRSWLGGRPMMPDDIAWPTAFNSERRERGRCPLHFVAQIACADLPKELWGGLGPRTGWLLLFLSGEDSDVSANKEALQVIHIPELGPEQEPPPNIGPVHDEIFTGPDYKFLRSQDDVPGEWRRWPVDLIAIPNRPIDNEDEHLTIIPEDLASALYEGAAVSPDKRISAPPQPPFSWRGALYVVDSVIRALSSNRRLPGIVDKDRETISTPAWFEESIAALDHSTARWLDSPGWRIANTPVPDDQDAEAKRLERKLDIEKRLDRLARTKHLLNETRNVDALWALLVQSREKYLAWRADGLETAKRLRASVLAHDLDTALPAEAWQELRTALEEESLGWWSWGYGEARRGMPVPIRSSLYKLAESGLRAALVQVAADYYTRSPELKSLVPPALIATLEPQWRQLYSNRPHRMGGIHDAIQSEPKPGPTSDLLLFQIATDDSMHWVWGDAGAYYAFIDTDRLASGDFDMLDASFENH